MHLCIYCIIQHDPEAMLSLFNKAPNDWHRLHPPKRNFKGKKKTGALRLNGMFSVKCLSSERLACFNPTITPLKRRLCDWWTAQPTVGSAAWPYYQNIQEYLSHSKAGVPVAVAFYRSPCSNKVWFTWLGNSEKKVAIYMYSACVFACVWVGVWETE